LYFQILGLVSVLLSIVALADVQKVIGPLTLSEEEDGSRLSYDVNPAAASLSIQAGREKLSRNLFKSYFIQFITRGMTPKFNALLFLLF
jgi:hypothetical protein